MLKELLKLSNHLNRKGLLKEADYLNHAMENYIDEMEDDEMEEDIEEDMMPEDDFEESPESSFSEMEDDMGEMEDDMGEMEDDMDMSGEELSFEGVETEYLHCCPETKEFLSYLMGVVDSEEEKAIFIEMLEGSDSLLRCKEELSMQDPSKSKLLEFIDASNSVMYSCGMLSSLLNEDLEDRCSVFSSHVEECLSQALEDEAEGVSAMEEVAMEEPDLDEPELEEEFTFEEE